MPSIWAPAQRALLAPPLATTAAATTVDHFGLCFQKSRHHGCCGGMGELIVIVIVSAQVRARVNIISIAKLNY